MGFQTYMDDVRSQLTCNAPNSEHVTFEYTPEQVQEHLIYFLKCFKRNLSPYKALTFFIDYLNGDCLIE